MKDDAERYRIVDLGPTFESIFMFLALRVEAGDHNISSRPSILVGGHTSDKPNLPIKMGTITNA